MATTRAILLPGAAEFPAASFPQYKVDAQRRPLLAYVSGEEGYWTLIAPQGLTGTLTAVISYYMETAATNYVRLEVRVEAVGDGDSQDMDATSGWDTTNQSDDDIAVPGTQGYMEQISVVLANKDSIAVADYVRIGVKRVAPSGTDAADDMHILAVELRDAA